MRVICINNGPIWSEASKDFLPAPELKEGESYTVETISPTGKGLILKEIKSNTNTKGYKAERFIECSDIDESKMQRKVNVLHI